MAYGKDYTSADKKKIQPLNRFKCCICGHYKSHELFSNKQLNTYRDRVASGHRLTAESARLRCSACNGESALELVCQGPCGLTKELSEFSKNSRRTRRNWCDNCTKWKDAQEAGVITGPAPNNEIAPDEGPSSEGLMAWDPDEEHEDEDYGMGTSSNCWYSEQHTNSAGWGSVVDAPSTTATRATSNVSGAGVVGSMMASLSITGNTTNGNANTLQQRSTTANGNSPSLPPHLRHTASQSSASNPYETASSGTARTGTTNGWTQVNGNTRGAIAYNAWGPNGQQQTQVRYPSSAEPPSRSVSSASQSTARPSIASGNLSYRRSPPPPAKKSNGWAKPVGTKSQSAQPPAATPRTSSPTSPAPTAPNAGRPAPRERGLYSAEDEDESDEDW